MDLQFTDEEIAFRDEVRAFLKENIPADIKERAKIGWNYLPKEDYIRWQKALYEKGWIAPGWPKEHGGTGWNAAQRFIFEEECARANCPRVQPFGVTMVGPVIYTFGNQAQKDRFLPRILSSDDWWCQGYSERGAGSDLAGLATKAVRDGDEYVVNGHKIWTSGAHRADWMFCLVRTSAEGKKQEGITFLLIDMKTPGIEVKPIISMDGYNNLNEVFFDDVRVPVENRIGEENKGWTYAKFLLGNERTGIAGIGRSKSRLAELKDMARAEPDNGARRLIDDPGFAVKLAQIEADLNALEMYNLRCLADTAAGKPPGAEASMLKIRGTEIEQAINETMVEAIAYFSAPYVHTGLNWQGNEEPVGPKHADGVMPEHLLKRAATIYGGTTEVQKNVIAKAVLGL
ncbi:acyl-CoA dehydrogenase family protein [Minwuia thermotolerans]|uniref:Pimeloyl-CoA dehydrogenase large subunit n=1 Tax=Minwuia thermotolerans TaxID=2056226 RepID=A0A2M9G537_9PROT|nr:acyl-CoA dehydrogenase family protein [Minwuia thermotolerans]PJK30814.1 pimeloyl-CoA dehydrogenase large subunit [Minwuia thermotolerans]